MMLIDEGRLKLTDYLYTFNDKFKEMKVIVDVDVNGDYILEPAKVRREEGEEKEEEKKKGGTGSVLLERLASDHHLLTTTTTILLSYLPSAAHYYLRLVDVHLGVLL